MDQVTVGQKFIDFANILKAFIGSIYLSMPFAFYESGLIPGIVMLILIALINDYCCIKIVKCKNMIIDRLMVQFEQKLKNGILSENEAEMVRSGRLRTRWEDRMTLSHISKYAFGKKGQWVVTICLFMSQMGFCSNYMVFVGSSLLDVINSYNIPNNSSNVSLEYFDESVNNFGSAIVTINLIYLIIIPLPIFALFALIRSVRNLGYISVAANITIGIGCFTVLGLIFYQFSISDSYRLTNWKSLAVVFGLMTTAFEGIGVVIPIESSMIGNRHNFKKYLHAVICIIAIILGTFGIFGQLRYGVNTKQIILQNLNPGTFVTIINVVLIVSVICTYPLQMYPCIEIAEFIFFRKRSAQLLADRQKYLAEEQQQAQASASGYQSEYTDDQEELLAELSASESESELEEKNLKKRKRRYRKSKIANYGATDKSMNEMPNDGIINGAHVEIAVQGTSQLTKKEERMMRIVHGSKITAADWKRNLIRLSIVLLQLGIAIVMRYDFAYLSAFTGALGSSVLAYMLPGAVHYKLIRYETGKYDKVVRVIDILLVLFGIVGSIVTLVVTIIKVVQ